MTVRKTKGKELNLDLLKKTKKTRQIHPDLHEPMMGLAQAMFAVQEQLPSLLKGNPIHAPSNLVHEMFSKYSNGTKTEADLASIDRGLDELFFHDFSAEDNERLVDFIGAGDLFNQETVTIQPPQLVSRRERERGFDF